MLLLLLSLLQPSPDGPLPPDRELSTFRLADPDLVVELVASEPDIVSPVAIAWDESGALYVAEMTDYPVGPPSGRIRRLSDPDPATGRYRSVTFFARDVPFPTSVLPHDGGLLVTSAPDILFLKDDDGDGVADTRRAVVTGFGEGNQQLRVNALHFGLDNQIFGANGRSGGSLRRPDDAPDHAASIDRADFRLDPLTYAVQPITGFSQFGLARDDWGDRFPSWNTTPFRHVVLERDLLDRNPHYAAPTGVADIIPLGDVAVFPIATAPRTFNRESVRAFNATCGSTIYRGPSLGDAYLGDAFVAEPLTHLVHRRKLEPSGATYVASRPEQGVEFLASSDPWFHPVNFATGPDGCLYVVDFYREWVEHPDFVPPDSRGLVDWRHGADHGRLWRIRRRDTAPLVPPRLDRASTADLVSSLSHASAWVRDTAQRLLVARRPTDAVASLRSLAGQGPTPQSRVQALWTLEGLGSLDLDTLRPALGDPSPRVREQALRLAARDPGRASELLEPTITRASDADPRVRFRAALLLAPRTDRPSLEAVASVLARDASDPWLTPAVLTGVGPVLPLLEAMTAGGSDSWLTTTDPARLRFLQALGSLAGARREAREDAAIVARARAGAGSLALLSGLVEGRSQGVDAPPADPSLDPALDAAAQALDDHSHPPIQRSMALRLLLRARPAALPDRLAGLLDAQEDPLLQRSAAEAVDVLDDPESTAGLLESWGQWTTSTRRALLDALVRSPRLAVVLADALEDGTIAPAEVEADLRVTLGELAEAGVRDRLTQLLGATSTDREAVVRDYVQAMKGLGAAPSAARGADLFARHCSNCHRLAGQGHEVGPDLTGVSSRPPEVLADDILNPSREVSPDFRCFVAADRDGRVLTGLLVSEAPAGITLRGPASADSFVSRDQLEALRPTSKSLMPEGLEAQLPPDQLADLVAFLKAPRPEKGD